LQRAAAKKGPEIVQGNVVEGYNRIFVSDPFGNRIELLQKKP
jgi:hypothetical protein